MFRTWWHVGSVALLLLVIVVGASVGVLPAQAQGAPGLRYIGFSTRLSPSSNPIFRQGVAYGVDRASVIQALSAQGLLGNVQPASAIQHPRLPGANSSVKSYSFDPGKAKELLAQTGWTGTITISVGPASNRFLETFNGAVIDSLRRSLGTAVAIQVATDFAALTRAAKAGDVAIWMFGWQADPRDFGYPSIALGIANEYFASDQSIRELTERKDAQAVEQALLEKALVVPLIHF